MCAFRVDLCIQQGGHHIQHPRAEASCLHAHAKLSNLESLRYLFIRGLVHPSRPPWTSPSHDLVLTSQATTTAEIAFPLLMEAEHDINAPPLQHRNIKIGTIINNGQRPWY